MKKIVIVAFFVLILPAASFANDKMVYGIADNMITLVEGTISCTAPGGLCTEADAIALKADAGKGLRDIMGLIMSGNLSGMKLSTDQTLYLSSRLEALKSQFVHIGMFETACNLGFVLLNYGVFLIGAGLFYLLPLPPVGIVGLLGGIVLVPVSCLVLLTCLFWWL
jgi:hypothetical protein